MASYVALCGGVGGAKLALGLSHVLAPEELTIVVNTGDDFEHLGLHISPDLDTVTYTLAELSNKEQGWGLAEESWQCMAALDQLGGETWFRLGDKDLATHIYRTQALAQGQSLTQVTTALTQQLGIKHRIIPMTDASVRTVIHTPDGDLAFQHYFVREQCQPSVTGFNFNGVEDATLTSALSDALNRQDLAGVIICPSNPFVSIDPILMVPGLKTALMERHVPIVAISPIVGGLAIKGPTAKMMQELAIPNTPKAVVDHYGELLTGFIYDATDPAFTTTNSNLHLKQSQTIMQTLDDRINLARETIDFIQSISAVKAQEQL